MATSVQESLNQEDDTMRGKFLTFNLDKQVYGIDIRYAREIISFQPITEVPDLPEYVQGIINLRGKIIPVMDVRTRFNKQFREYTDRTCIIVIEVKHTSVGLIVDRVAEVLTIPDTEIVAPPEVNQVGNKYIKGIGKVGSEVKLLLDCEKLLNEQETGSISQISEI